MPYLSTHLRHGMHTSRLPLEICEHVIDSACYEDPDEDWLHGTSYRTWCQTAIVCYYWLPRSQLNLFRDIQIRSASRLDLLLRTLSDTPHLADLVYGIRIAPLKSEYIAFARLLNPQLLRNCIRMQFIGTAWEAFPSRYATDRILYKWRNLGLTHFAIELEQGCCASVLRFLYTLPRLQELTLDAIRKTIHIPENVLAILHDQPCPFTNLRKLVLWHWASTMTFPPLLFPDSITHLTVDVENGVSGTTMGLLQSLWQLQHLQAMCFVSNAIPPKVAMESEAWRIQPLLTFLGSLPARPSAGLTQLTITFYPLALPDDKGTAYEVTRECFLDNVLGCTELTDTFRTLSALHLLCVKIYENDLSRYDEKWWMAEIATRLQVYLHASTVIDATLWGEEGSDLLWCTKTEVDKALGWDDAEDEAPSADNVVLSDNDDNVQRMDDENHPSPGAENVALPPSRSQSPNPAAPSLPSTPSVLL